MVIPIDKLDDVPATQHLDCLQHFGREFLCMVGHQVRLDFIWTSPHEITEGASSPGRVLVRHMSCELLRPYEVLVAIRTDKPRLAAHHTNSLAFGGGSVELCLRIRHEYALKLR